MSWLHKAGQVVLFSSLVQISPLSAAELRTWTSVKGATIEAKFQKMDEKEVHLLTPESKVIEVRIEDLSLADRQHLVEYTDADKKILTDVELTVPEKDIRFDKKTLKSLEEKMLFGDQTELEFDVLESEHFLIATTGRFRPQPLAEMAERLWHGMAFQHMNFRQDWGDKKMVVIVTTDDEVYETLGKYYVKWLRENVTDEEKGEAAALRLSRLWMEMGGTSIELPEEQQKEYNAFDSARIFRIRDGWDSSYKKVFGAFPTHGLAGMLLSHQMGGVSEISPTGYFSIITGHGYFKEIQLAGKSETKLVNASDYEGDDDEFTSSSGFSDGRSWAKTLRKLVRKGEVKPDLEKLLSYQSANLTPEELVLIYSFAYYMQSDSARIAAFAKMVSRVESNNQVPAPIEMARIFGFETVEAFQNDWTEFVKSTDFK